MTNQPESRETKPVDRNNEHISALVDGELDPKGAAFLVRRLSDDPHMHHQWQRFHLVRACLQREFSGPVSLVGRVQAALQDEESDDSYRLRELLEEIHGAEFFGDYTYGYDSEF